MSIRFAALAWDRRVAPHICSPHQPHPIACTHIMHPHAGFVADIDLPSGTQHADGTTLRGDALRGSCCSECGSCCSCCDRVQLLQAIARVTARCSAAFFCFQLYLAFLAVVGFWCDATARRKQALQSAIDRCYRQVVATVKSALAASAPAAVRFACAVLLLGTATWLVGVPPNPPAAWLIVGASFAHVVGTSSFPHVVANESEKEDGEDSTNEEDLPAPEEMTESQKIIAAFEEELEHENVSGPWDVERAIAASAISETERIERIRINEKLEAAMLSAAIAASLIEAARVEDAAGAAANTQIASWQMRGDVASAGPAANAEAAKAETASAEAAGMAAREYHDDSEDSSPSESEEWEEEGWLLL